jgi:hypothetical protein
MKESGRIQIAKRQGAPVQNTPTGFYAARMFSIVTALLRGLCVPQARKKRNPTRWAVGDALVNPS